MAMSWNIQLMINKASFSLRIISQESISQSHHLHAPVNKKNKKLINPTPTPTSPRSTKHSLPCAWSINEASSACFSCQESDPPHPTSANPWSTMHLSPRSWSVSFASSAWPTSVHDESTEHHIRASKSKKFVFCHLAKIWHTCTAPSRPWHPKC